ncbi:PRC-barrel domain containing protein [Isoptericola sp. NPDC057191]|uniref:PRC-barrel domain containing protein n=1 Tax=Isoptericola sp. NPDC057191 TaxID=3346041 RepID=UPI0036257651
MNVGDLLDVRVLGPDGAVLGVVVDVRLALEVVDEPEGGPGQGEDREEAEHEPPLSAQARRDAVGRARLVGLLVGPRGAGSFHGYERKDVRSPWPIPQLVRRRHRGTFLVGWEDVATAEIASAGDDDAARYVRLAPGYTERPPALD